MAFTLKTLQEKVKRRIRVLRASSPGGTEAEAGSFSNASITDAINAGRKQLMISVKNAEKWGSQNAYFTTSANVQEYKLADTILRMDAVLYDVTSAGLRQADTVEAIDVVDRKGEEAAIADPMNAPSSTNPKFRITNKGVKIIVSTDGTVTASKYIKVEYLRDLTDIITGSQASGLPDSLDELVVNWAVWLLCMFPVPQVAVMAKQTFDQQVAIMNQRKF